MDFIIAIVNGLSLGGTYAMIAIGYTMVYGIAKMLNFAHGDVIMVGGYAMYVTLLLMELPVIALLFAILFCVVLGICIERFAYKPLRGASPLAVLITAIAKPGSDRIRIRTQNANEATDLRLCGIRRASYCI